MAVLLAAAVCDANMIPVKCIAGATLHDLQCKKQAVNTDLLEAQELDDGQSHLKWHSDTRQNGAIQNCLKHVLPNLRLLTTRISALSAFKVDENGALWDGSEGRPCTDRLPS